MNFFLSKKVSKNFRVWIGLEYLHNVTTLNVQHHSSTTPAHSEDPSEGDNIQNGTNIRFPIDSSL